MYFIGLLWGWNEWTFVNYTKQCLGIGSDMNIWWINKNNICQSEHTSDFRDPALNEPRDKEWFSLHSSSVFLRVHFLCSICMLPRVLLKAPKRPPLSQRLPGKWAGKREHQHLVSDRSMHSKSTWAKFSYFCKTRILKGSEEWADYNRVELSKVPQWNGWIRAEPMIESHWGGNLWGTHLRPGASFSCPLLRWCSFQEWDFRDPVLVLGFMLDFTLYSSDCSSTGTTWELMLGTQSLRTLHWWKQFPCFKMIELGLPIKMAP